MWFSLCVIVFTWNITFYYSPTIITLTCIVVFFSLRRCARLRKKKYIYIYILPTVTFALRYTFLSSTHSNSRRFYCPSFPTKYTYICTYLCTNIHSYCTLHLYCRCDSCYNYFVSYCFIVLVCFSFFFYPSTNQQSW